MARPRHRWLKIKMHVYICRSCGTGRVNALSWRGDWFTTFHRPDGSAVVDTHVPPCEPGPKTAAYLGKYRSALACAEGPS